jgi:hypothetical protein
MARGLRLLIIGLLIGVLAPIGSSEEVNSLDHLLQDSKPQQQQQLLLLQSQQQQPSPEGSSQPSVVSTPLVSEAAKLEVLPTETSPSATLEAAPTPAATQAATEEHETVTASPVVLEENNTLVLGLGGSDAPLASMEAEAEEAEPVVVVVEDDADGDEADVREAETQEAPPVQLVNYAKAGAGAVIMRAEGQNAAALLREDKDSYYMAQCSNPKKFVDVRLSEDVRVRTVTIANYEKYASSVKEFQILGSQAYPSRQWVVLGTFTAKDSFGEQSFSVTLPSSSAVVRFIRLKWLSFHRSEYYCTMSNLKVQGDSVLQELQRDLDLVHQIEDAQDFHAESPPEEEDILPPPTPPVKPPPVPSDRPLPLEGTPSPPDPTLTPPVAEPSPIAEASAPPLTEPSPVADASVSPEAEPTVALPYNASEMCKEPPFWLEFDAATSGQAVTLFTPAPFCWRSSPSFLLFLKRQSAWSGKSGPDFLSPAPVATPTPAVPVPVASNATAVPTPSEDTVADNASVVRHEDPLTGADAVITFEDDSIEFHLHGERPPPQIHLSLPLTAVTPWFNLTKRDRQEFHPGKHALSTLLGHIEGVSKARARDTLRLHTQLRTLQSQVSDLLGQLEATQLALARAVNDTEGRVVEVQAACGRDIRTVARNVTARFQAIAAVGVSHWLVPDWSDPLDVARVVDRLILSFIVGGLALLFAVFRLCVVASRMERKLQRSHS